MYVMLGDSRATSFSFNDSLFSIIVCTRINVQLKLIK
jgi:hypothetical protein